MANYVYKVRCLVEQDIAEQWIQFFQDKHLDDVMKTGFFTECKFFEVETQSKLTRTFCSVFYYNKKEDLEAYNATAAGALKADTKQKFGDKFSCQRELMQELTSFAMHKEMEA